MKTLLKTSAGVLALMFGAGMAVAQTDSGTASGMGAMPSDFTCDQLAGLDDQQAEQRIYFIAGYQAAQDAGFGTDSTASTTTGADTGMDATAAAPTGADSGTDTTAGATTGTETETDTTASATTTPDAGAGTETDMTAGADTGAGAVPGTDTTTTAGNASDTTGSTAGGTGAMGGFPDISVETVMSECENNPDMLVLDILSQQQGAQ